MATTLNRLISYKTRPYLGVARHDARKGAVILPAMPAESTYSIGRVLAGSQVDGRTV